MTNKELRELQLNLLDILKYIDSVCKENKITYYLIYGTCIGAVRHNGFIPWDDDLDIAMPIEDYKKFCKILSENNNKRYFLQTRETDKNYYLDFAKVRDTETTLIDEYNYKKRDIVLGTYIDVFPLVGVPNNKLKKKVQKINRALYFAADRNMINNKIIKKTFDLIVKIVGKERIRRICYKNMMKYSCKECDVWFSIFGEYYEKDMHPKSYYGKGKRVKYEDIKVPVPEDYDSYLKKLYGDYMKLPDESKRQPSHSIKILDLKNSYTKYINKKK